ncbi:MAG: hypothetical protein PUE66_01585 [Erysipelotrichaceae bacterium]|nr:hypothetical protein [Erysipelotrichaceae bacterium]
MEEYKSNSYRSKETQKNDNVKPEDRKIEKVVTGVVKTKKKSKISQAMDNFISEDAKNVKSYVFGEVLIPAIKKAISDIVTDGIDIILYGEARGRNKRSTADRVSYRSYYDDRGGRNRMNERQAIMAGSYSYDDIILSTRGEAEDVLSRMDELIETYGLVRVADLYDLVGITGNYTDNKYGWMNIRNAEIIRVRDGYMIKMPRAVPID